MRPNLKQQFINRLLETDMPFYATFYDRRLNLNLSERIYFEKVGSYWSADIARMHMRLLIGKHTKASIHLYRHVAGCKLSVIIPLSQLAQIQPAQP